jgi:hypothetical protein
MSDELKQLVKRYNDAYEASKMLPELKARILPLIKSQNLQRIKFNFGSHSIGYHSYNDYDGVTQKMIKETLERYYPNINKDEFIKKLLSSRRQKQIETLRIQPQTQTK